MPEFMAYEDRSETARRLAEQIADTLRSALAEREQASLVVCGGSSPVELFAHLAHQALDWSRVTVLPSDERWVPVDDAQSNERMIRETLLVGPAASARLVGLYRDTATPADACPDVDATLAEVPGPLDVVLLGMGDDGHTASLFPHAPDIEAALASTARCVPADVGPPARLSLGLAYLTRARRIDLLIFGDEKKAVYEQAIADGPIAALPVRGILKNTDPAVSVHWAP